MIGCEEVLEYRIVQNDSLLELQKSVNLMLNEHRQNVNQNIRWITQGGATSLIVGRGQATNTQTMLLVKL